MNTKSEITSDDLRVSSQANDMSSLVKALRKIRSQRIERMIDLGCGYGGVTRFVADYFDIPEAYGIDMDDRRLPRAKLRGIKIINTDLSKETLPFPDKHLGLVTCFGVLEHLVYFDNLLGEAGRVLENDGYFVVAMPNLGSYVNRIAILLGYQPRNVEISTKFSPGLLPGIKKGHIAHVHSATLRCMKELMQCYGFHVIGVGGSSPFRVNPNGRCSGQSDSICPQFEQTLHHCGKEVVTGWEPLPGRQLRRTRWRRNRTRCAVQSRIN